VVADDGGGDVSPALITAVAFLVATLLVSFALPRLHARYERRADEALAKLGRTFLADPDSRYYGYPLSRKSGVSSGVVYPVLSKMLDEGWLSCGWETEAELGGAKRPPRRWYRLTDTGLVRLTTIVEKAGEKTG
jgi:PadR family transcriptional regulator PadR